MVDDDARQIAAPGSISPIVDILLLSTSHTEIAHDDIVAIGTKGIIAQGDARSGGRLTQNGGVGTDGDILAEGYNATDVENNNFLGTATDSLTEGTRARVIKVGHMDHLASTSTRDKASVTLGTRESRSLRLYRQRKDYKDECSK